MNKTMWIGIGIGVLVGVIASNKIRSVLPFSLPSV